MNELSAAQVASLVGGRLHGDGALAIVGVCTVSSPRAGHLCFVTDFSNLTSDPTSERALLLATADAAGLTGTWIEVEQPRVSFAIAATALELVPRLQGISPSATVSPDARLGPDVAVGASTVIEADVVIGPRAVVGHNVTICSGVSIGADCIIGHNSVLGGQGFGIVDAGDGRLVRMPHVGGVEIGDNVEIGALTTILAGTIEPTRVKNGAMIDDHVHIAHNCQIGSNVLITACAEVSGSVEIGDGCWIGPNAAIRDKLAIEAGAFIGIGAVVTKSIREKAVFAGNPAKRIRAL